MLVEADLAVDETRLEHWVAFQALLTGNRVQAECREPRTVLLVAEAVATDKAAQVAGVVLIWCIADEAQVMEVAVSPELQQRGIGYQLLKEALAVSSQSVFTPCMKRLKALTIARCCSLLWRD